jgi:hypothetical protein
MSEQELDSGGFHKNYRILKETANWLSKQEEPDIDRVERAIQADRICNDRLDRSNTYRHGLLSIAGHRRLCLRRRSGRDACACHHREEPPLDLPDRRGAA